MKTNELPAVTQYRNAFQFTNKLPQASTHVFLYASAANVSFVCNTEANHFSIYEVVLHHRVGR